MKLRHNYVEIVRSGGARIVGVPASDRAIFEGDHAMASEVEATQPSNGHHQAKHLQRFFRFHVPHMHLAPVFGDDWFALKAEAFARFFGTPIFLIGQTVFVAGWIVVNAVGVTTFDVYPFILLNLAFSTQAAYAAPLILLAQTRQADRDKAHALADAEHRDELHRVSDERARTAVEQTKLLLDLMQQNTDLTMTVKSLTERVEALTKDVHASLVKC